MSPEYFKIALNIILATFAICGFIGAIYVAIRFIENTVKLKIESKETIEQLAKLIRPSVIFDTNEVILADLGAMDFIKSIKVSSEKELGGIVPTQIEIDCKNFIALPPLLTSLDTYTYAETVERGPGFSWIYKLNPVSYTEAQPFLRFRIEIL